MEIPFLYRVTKHYLKTFDETFIRQSNRIFINLNNYCEGTVEISIVCSVNGTYINNTQFYLFIIRPDLTTAGDRRSSRMMCECGKGGTGIDKFGRKQCLKWGMQRSA